MRDIDGKGEGGGKGDGVKERGEEEWHWNTQQRKMMKAEVSDAFRIRKGVLVGLGVVMLVVLGGVWVIGRWVVSLVWCWALERCGR